MFDENAPPKPKKPRKKKERQPDSPDDVGPVRNRPPRPRDSVPRRRVIPDEIVRYDHSGSGAAYY